MPTAAPPTAKHRLRTATTTGVVALTWCIAAAVYIAEIVEPDVVGPEEVILAVALAGIATIVRATQYVADQIAIQHQRCQVDTAGAVDVLRRDMDQVCLRVDAMGRRLAESLAVRMDDERDRVEAETARTVMSGVETLRNIPVLTDEVATAVANGKLAYLNGRHR